MRHRAFPRLLTTLLITLVPCTAVAQEVETTRSDDRVAEALAVVEVWLDAQQAYEEIPGISAAVVSDQEIVWSGAVGQAHPARGEAATPRTIYSICSISKLFTGIAVMQLRDAGRLRLSDPVADHLPSGSRQRPLVSAGRSSLFWSPGSTGSTLAVDVDTATPWAEACPHGALLR